MSRPRKIFASALLVLVTAVAGTLTFLEVAGRRVEERLSELERQLGGPVLPGAAHQGEKLVARLVGLDAYLEQRVPHKDGPCSPGKWGPEQRAQLEADLASLGSFLEQVDALVASPECRSYLQRRLTTGERVSSLVPVRHRTNVLCAQALVEFDGAGGSAAAARRLGQALDLIALGDDGGAWSYQLSTASEDIVLRALQRMLLDPRADARTFHEELGQRLACLAEPGRFEKVLRQDLPRTFDVARVLARRSWPVPLASIGELIQRQRLADCLRDTIDLARMSGTESRRWMADNEARFGQGGESWGQVLYWLFLADQSHLVRVQRTLALAALDVAMQAEGEGGVPANRSTLPADSYSGGSFRVEQGDSGLELHADAALATLGGKPGRPGADLLCWTIPR